MATEHKTPLPKLGKITIRVDRVYGVVTIYPVCERAKLLAELAGTATLTDKSLRLAGRLGFEIVLAEGSANALNAELNKRLALQA